MLGRFFIHLSSKRKEITKAASKNMISRTVFSFKFSTNKKNPYVVLGIKQDATTQQIKKSFRKIAQQYHPDKNSDPKAKQIFVEAKQYDRQIYQFQRDKRSQHDAETSGYGSRGYGFDKNPFDEFNDDIFKDRTRVYPDSHSAGSSRKRKGDNITKVINLTFLEAAKGTNFDLRYSKRGTCQTCNGNRCKPGTAPTRCLSCGGSGSTIFRKDSVVMHLQCSRCKGIGLIIKNPCQTCKATGVLVQDVIQTIEVPPGADNNQTITLEGKGNHSENGPNGDLFIKLTIAPDQKFTRKNNDIFSTIWLTISQAALGYNTKIQTIWGTEQLKIPQGTQDGQKITIKDKGIHRSLNNGNHNVIARIEIPTKLTQKQKRIFQQLAKQQSPVNEQQKKDFKQRRNQDFQDTQNEDNIFSKFKDYFK